MKNAMKKLFGWLKFLATRRGLVEYLDRYKDLAIEELEKLRKINNNASFHEWHQQAFERLQLLTGEVKGTWVSILINIAWDVLKNRGF